MIIAFVLPSFAWYNPATNTEDNTSYNTWGPKVKSVLCVIHSDEIAEYNSFLAELIDMFDWTFTPEQLTALNTADPGMSVYERLHFTEFGMMEVDINNQVFPGTIQSFRTALSKLINKDLFCSTTLAGLAVAAHSPLWHNPTWRYEPCAHFTSEIWDPAAAYALLLADGFKDWDSDGIVEYNGTGTVTEFNIVLYGRQDDSQRTALANLVNDVLTNNAMKASVVGGAFDVKLYITTKSICYARVMVDYNYTLYTGGWSFGRDPDTLYFLYDSMFATKPNPWAANYINYRSVPFDTAIEAMVTAANIPAAHLACNNSQNIFMGDVATIPVWNAAGSTGILGDVAGGHAVQHAIHLPAYGPTTSTGAYMTLLNAYMNDVEYGGTIRWGFMNNFESCSVYMSSWVWDWNILQEIFDSMIGYNPYDFTQDYGVMATSWSIGTWNYSGDICTSVTWNLRHDMYWHDIPAKSGRAYGILPSGATNVPVTADDVAFTVAYIGASSDAWNWGLVADVIYTNVKDPYTVTMYFDMFLPIFAAHWVGGLPIMPKEVWGSVPIAAAGSYDALAQQTLAGSGPFMFNYTAYVEGQFVKLDRFPNYHLSTPIDCYVTADGISVNPGTVVNYTVHLDSRDAQYTITGDLLVKVDGVTVNTHNGLVLTPKQTTTPYSGSTVALATGAHNVTAEFTITGSPDWMYGMKKTYPFHMYATIHEDLNYDFHVNAKDAVILGKAFNSKPGSVNWDSRGDINKDGFVNAKDAVLLGKKFNLPI
jgi:hypothetical protein